MDEILIEEKKYVSSKRAAKMTGYAKDYVGQLCREGRVPARLVGRGWYVLESAIQDHRFGSGGDDLQAEPASVATVEQDAWESPRYEASSDDLLPSLSRISPEVGPEGPVEAQNQASEHLENSWREWFDHVADQQPTADPVVMQEATEASASEIEPEEVKIPIHTLYQLPPEELLPRSVPLESSIESVIVHEEEVWDEPTREVREKTGVGVGMLRAIRFGGVTIAVTALLLAVAGSGYVDERALSNNQLSALAGVSVYNK